MSIKKHININESKQIDFLSVEQHNWNNILIEN